MTGIILSQTLRRARERPSKDRRTLLFPNAALS